jgi:hypothetical protein
MEYTKSYRFYQNDKGEQTAVHPSANPKTRFVLTEFSELDPLTVNSADLPEPFARLESAYYKQEQVHASLLARVVEIEPSSLLLKRWSTETDGDQEEIDALRDEWTSRVKAHIALLGEFEYSNNDGEIVIELGLKRDEFAKLSLDFWSDLPIRGETPITGIYLEDNKTKTVIEWSDRYGKRSRLLLMAGIIYPIRPFSILLKEGSTIQLLA